MPGGPEWLKRLPQLVEECRELWGLELEGPLSGGYASYVVPAGDAVLKISFPHDEAEHEAEALRAWDGCGAVRLLAHDPQRWALLVERCRPGTQLIELDDDAATGVVAGLLPQLWIEPPHGLRRLAELAGRWAVELPERWSALGRPFERTILDAAVSALVDLGPTQGPLVLANEDLHAANVLRAEREPWLVIDPKPIAAEREFTPIAMIRDVKEHLRRELWAEGVRRRLDRFSSELGLDRERVRGWALAHTVAWGMGKDGVSTGHVTLARLLMDAC